MEGETETSLVRDETSDEPVDPVPEGGIWGWLTVLGQFLNYFLVFGFCRVFTIFIEPFQAYYNISLTLVNAIPAVFSIGISLGGLIGGPIVEKLGARKTCLVFGGAPSIAFFIAYLAGTIYAVTVIAFVVISFCFGILFLASLKSIANYFDARRTFAMQIGSCGTSIGQFVMAPASALLILNYTVKGTFLILAGLYINLLVPAVLFKPVSDKKKSDGAKKAVAIDTSIFKMPTFHVYLWSQMLLNAG